MKTIPFVLALIFLMACSETPSTTSAPTPSDDTNNSIDVGPDDPAMDASQSQDSAQSNDVEVPPEDSTDPAEDTSTADLPPSVEVSPVHADETFEVQFTRGEVYGQGFRRRAWDDSERRVMDLVTDIYEPIGSTEMAKPVVVVIHGGGFVGGSTNQGPLVQFCRYFASRGFVAFSVDYRIAGHFGLLPEQWPSDFFNGIMSEDQRNALYPAGRDVKAAIRFIRANASRFGIHPDFFSAIGGSAGSFIALMVGVSDEEDYRDELTVEEDPTLESTHLGQSSAVQTIVDHWGGTAMLDILEVMDARERFDPTDAPIQIVHGTQDDAVPFAEAEAIKAHYEETGVDHTFFPLDAGHGPWNATIDGQRLWESAFEFVVEQQGLELLP